MTVSFWFLRFKTLTSWEWKPNIFAWKCWNTAWHYRQSCGSGIFSLFLTKGAWSLVLLNARVTENLIGVWVTKNEGMKWLYDHPRNDPSVFFKVKYFGVWAKGYRFQKINNILRQFGIFVPEPLHAVCVVKLKWPMHPFLPPSTCREVTLMPPISPGLHAQNNDLN